MDTFLGDPGVRGGEVQEAQDGEAREGGQRRGKERERERDIGTQR